MVISLHYTLIEYLENWSLKNGFALTELHAQTTCHIHLHYVSQQSLEDLVPSIAQEAVCVQRVLLVIKTQLHHVLFVLHFRLSRECYLGGRPAEIQRSHCGSARAKPVAHETILEKKIKGKQNQFLLTLIIQYHIY